jgi:GMP synthase (glutamine-hydrolysing)
MKRLLILQLRPETDASDDEYAAILAKCAISADQTLRIRVDREDIPSDLDVTDFSAVIVGGGPGCVSDAPEDKSETEARIERQIMDLMPQITALDHPYMGCCYGLGILAQHLGAEVSKARFGEPVGPTTCALTPDAADDPLLAGLDPAFDVFVGHKEAVQALPPGAVHLVRSDACPVQMIRYGRNVYATQFHPEADARDFERRIRVYRNHGYFPPEDADKLIAACHASRVIGARRNPAPVRRPILLKADAVARRCATRPSGRPQAGLSFVC